jgi:plasmid stabilization system protein ParE
MSAVLEFLPEASEEVEEATKYYEQRVPGLGIRFRVEVEAVCVAIIRQPLLWRKRPGGFSRANLPGFPFYIAYFIRGERILIAAVAHASRHPDYWKQRES